MSFKVLSLCGSLRVDSLNRLALSVAEGAVRAAGGEVESWDFREKALPIYDGDIEVAGLPAVVKSFKEAVSIADMILIASPEYNHSISGVLKNALDWASRGEANSLDGKVAAIFGVSPSPVGTARGQKHLRDTLSALNVFILPQPQVTLTAQTIDFINDEKVKSRIDNLVKRTIEYAQKVK
jgi:chromate reductase